MADEQKPSRGFGALTKERQRELAQKGGVMAHRKGRAHQWTVEEAREAGRKGGLTRGKRRKTDA